MSGSGSKLPHRPPSPNFISHYSLLSPFLGAKSQLRRQQMEAWVIARDEAKRKAAAGKKPIFLVGRPAITVPSKSLK